MLERLLVAALVLLGPASAQAAPKSSLRVSVTGFQSLDGHVVCALFRSKSGFPDGRHALRSTRARVGKAGATCRFGEVPRGTYAVALFHDADDDGELDTFLGIPQEGFGFSRDARPSLFGPPSFERAAFRVVRGPYALSVRLQHL
ncbi:MAG: DUF2141 domain-containing protein [Polyangiaceae bacterium]